MSSCLPVPTQRVGPPLRDPRGRAPWRRPRVLARAAKWLLSWGLGAVFLALPATAAAAAARPEGGAGPAIAALAEGVTPGGSGAAPAAAAASPVLPAIAPASVATPVASPSAPASVPASAPECTRPFSLGLHEHGLLYSSQTGEGIDKDIADELARRSGCHIKLLVMPRARIWQLLETGAMDFSLSAIANEAREQFAAYAWYLSNKYYLLVRRDADVREVEDFRRHSALKLGAIRSFRYGPQANRFVDRLDEEQRVTYASGLDPLYQILIENHIQGMIIEPVDYPAIEGSQLRALTTILEFDDPPVLHGLVMSRKSLSPAQQQAWRDVMGAMRADGTVLRIFEKYFPADIARAMTQF
jgi:polar amino acid transport system substrate-binding protein